jgi:hypothetical protein
MAAIVREDGTPSWHVHKTTTNAATLAADDTIPKPEQQPRHGREERYPDARIAATVKETG